MKLARLGTAGHEIPALIDGDGAARDLRSITADLDSQFFQSDGVERVRAAAAAGTLPRTLTTWRPLGSGPRSPDRRRFTASA